MSNIENKNKKQDISNYQIDFNQKIGKNKSKVITKGKNKRNQNKNKDNKSNNNKTKKNN